MSRLAGESGFETVITTNGEEKVPVVYTQNKDSMILRGKEHNNQFITSGGFYRSDWYDLIGEYESYEEAKSVMDAYYGANPFNLYKAIHNSMNPNKI